MKRIIVSTYASSWRRLPPVPARCRRSAVRQFGFAAGATFPVGDLGDATSTGFHILGTLSLLGHGAARRSVSALMACTTACPGRARARTSMSGR